MDPSAEEILVEVTWDEFRVLFIRLCQFPEFDNVSSNHQLYRARKERSYSRYLATYPRSLPSPRSPSWGVAGKQDWEEMDRCPRIWGICGIGVHYRGLL